MTATSQDFTTTLLSKTPLGVEEMQARKLGLTPLERRVLILIDGKRNFQELAAMAGNVALPDILANLMEKGCIQATGQAAPPAAAAPPAQTVASVAGAGAAAAGELSGLPDPEMRSPKEVEMARNFMMNTVNTVFQPNTRLSLLEAIAACKTAEDARRVYPRWAETIASSAIGARRLPEFREKLLQVL
ncbi:MAG: hypothetical protein Fur0019_06000 [Tibeticola sp.]